MSQSIKCPSCKTIIDLDKLGEEKYKHILEEQETKLKQAHLEKEKEFEKTLEEKTTEMRKKAIEFAKEEAEKQRKKDAVEMEDLKARLEEEKKKADEMQKQELELRKKGRELEDKAKNADLEMQRKLDEEKVKLEKTLGEQMAKTQEDAIKKQVEEQKKQDEEARIKLEEEFRKKELEFLKQQDQLKRSLDDAKRKAEQGSQQIQGDIQEEDLRDTISQAFPFDSISDVATGVKGADLIQEVRNNLGQTAGTIVWESKNTKAWQDAWLMKLKDDKLKVSGNIAILITTVLPKDVKNFAMIDDVMIATPEFAIPVAKLLRDKLLSISKTERSLEGKDAKMEMLYKYLGSEEFGSKMNMMVDVFSNLKAGIDSERRAMEKNWKKREKDLERATYAVTGMYGELESLMGHELPGAQTLALDDGEDK